MTYYEDIQRQKAEIGNYKPFFTFRNIFIFCLVFVLGGAYLANEKRDALQEKIEKAKQDSVKNQTAKHEEFTIH